MNMTHQKYRLIGVMLAISTLAAPAFAASSAASSAYESVTTSVGSLSDSVEGSSKSSSKPPRPPLAAGDYKVIAVAAIADKPGMMRITLQAVNAPAETADFALVMPQKAFDTSGLAKGELVTAKDRSYGTEFSNKQTQAAFFLVLNDDAHRELASNPVTL
jgi:hypothetical protein